MQSSNSLPYPSLVQFAIGGRENAYTNHIGSVRREGAPAKDTMFGVVENEGATDFTFSMSTGVSPTASIRLTAQPADTNIITVNDNVTTVIFEFDNNASITGGRTSVAIGATLRETMENLRTAIASSALNVTVSFASTGSGGSIIYLTHKNVGSALNNAITKTGANITVTGFTGGTGAAHNILVNGSSVASVVVKPGARVSFAYVVAATDVQNILNLYAAPASGVAFGRVTLGSWMGILQMEARHVTV